VPIHEYHRSATFPRFDPSVPHPARIYGYWLGGKDHYPPDREAAQRRANAAVLHFIPDADDPGGIVAALAGQLAPGSYLAISHLTGDFAPGPVGAGVSAYNTLVPTALIPRTHSRVSALFAGLPLVPPGVVPLTEWRPVPVGPSPWTSDMYAGVARAPGGSTQPIPVPVRLAGKGKRAGGRNGQGW
jgi:hypothetical protein